MPSFTLKALLYSSLTTAQLKQIHSQIITTNVSDVEPLLVQGVLRFAGSCSSSVVLYVQNILLHSKLPDAFSWTCTIRHFSLHGYFNDTLHLYCQMLSNLCRPCSFALSSALRACARTAGRPLGTSLHCQSYKYGFADCVYVQTALVDLYSKLGCLDSANKVFDGMVHKNVVSWNTIMSGYIKSSKLEEAQNIFDKMPVRDLISWNSLLSGYASLGDMKQAATVFQQMPARNCASWNGMLKGYADCGDMKSAKDIFDSIPNRNSISWITMITGYAKDGDVDSACALFHSMKNKNLHAYNALLACFSRNNKPKQALDLFNEMVTCKEFILPDKMTLVCVISACSKLGDIQMGSWIESYIKTTSIEMDDHLRTSLADLHAKVGNISKVYELFYSLKKLDVVAYSVVIYACAINGKVSDAEKFFQDMVNMQIRPNAVTFTGLLTAYNHAGLVEEGYKCFTSMHSYDLEPSIDHYAIMADLFGRAGRLQNAFDLISGMPMQPYVEIWGALLLACSIHTNVKFGEIAARHCFSLEPNTAAYYSLLAKIYSSVGRWKDVKKLGRLFKKKKLEFIPGYSWTEQSWSYS